MSKQNCKAVIATTNTALDKVKLKLPSQEKWYIIKTHKAIIYVLQHNSCQENFTYIVFKGKSKSNHRSRDKTTEKTILTWPVVVELWLLSDSPLYFHIILDIQLFMMGETFDEFFPNPNTFL